MAKKLERLPDQQLEIERFKEAARAFGCDDDEAAFKQKLGVIVRNEPTRYSAEVSDKERGWTASSICRKRPDK